MGALAAVAAGASGVGTLLQLAGNADEEANNQKQAAFNAELADRAAAEVTILGSAAAGRARMQGSALIAKQKVAFANSGVDATVGTPAAVAAESRAWSELDAKTIENNAAKEAWGYKVQAHQTREQASASKRALFNRQLGTALGGLGRVASMYSPGKPGG